MNEYILVFDNGEYMVVFVFDGIVFEMVDILIINDWYEKLNIVWCMFVYECVVVMVYIICCIECGYFDGDFCLDFVCNFDVIYRGCVFVKCMFVNEYFLMVIYWFVVGVVDKVVKLVFLMFLKVIVVEVEEDIIEMFIDILCDVEKFMGCIKLCVFGIYEFNGL